MKNISCLASVLFCIFLNSATPQWVIQYTTSELNGVTSINFLDTLKGITSGFKDSSGIGHGKILFTFNSGLTWNFSSLPDSLNTIVDTKIISHDLYYACGNFIVSGSDMILSNSNSQTYNSKPIGYQCPLSADGFTYKGAFLLSTDNGATWKSHGVVPNNIEYFTRMDFLNTNYGFAGCSIGNLNPIGALVKTTNGGESWEFMNLPSPTYEISSIKIFDSLNIVVAGTKRPEFPNPNFTGLIFRTSDGGANWFMESIPEVNSFKYMKFANSTTGICIGNSNAAITSGSIYRTTNSGINWNNITASGNDTAFFNNVDMLSDGTALIAGDKYNAHKICIFKSTDLGLTWRKSIINTDKSAYALKLINAKKYYLGARKPFIDFSIFFSDTGGETFINYGSTILPDKFSLSQNYPNPFNPNTIINYQLTINSYISLNVYDANGRLIKILESGFKPAGNYETSFSAEGLSSGVYYYSLYADGVLMDTKKAVILK